MNSARILSIQVGKPKIMSYRGANDEQDRSWESGIYKTIVEGPLWAGTTNLNGDGQVESIHHGGPDRPILMYAARNYPRWEQELGRSLKPGSFGENLTVDSIDEDDACIGDVWQTERVTLEISQPRIPCYKLGRRLESPEIASSVMNAAAGGWYCRVLAEGELRAGEELKLVERPNPEWTVRRAFNVFVFDREDNEARRELGSLAALSETWKDRLSQISVV